MKSGSHIARTPAVLDKLAVLGALLSAAACPVCFPLLAAAGAALGLGVLARWEGYALYALQGFVLLALTGNVLTYRVHRKIGPLAVAIVGSLLVFFALYVWFNPLLIYTGLSGLMAAAVWNVVVRRRCAACDPSDRTQPILRSVITCPNCGFRKEEAMPMDACQFFYECRNCKALLKPRPGDCCVFCSYGTIPCPHHQQPTSRRAS